MKTFLGTVFSCALLAFLFGGLAGASIGGIIGLVIFFLVLAWEKYVKENSYVEPDCSYVPPRARKTEIKNPPAKPTQDDFRFYDTRPGKNFVIPCPSVDEET